MIQAATFGAEPYVFVLDIDKAIDFYQSKLGFRLAIQDGDPCHFAQVERGGARLNLRHVDRPVIEAQRRESEELLTAAITVPDIASLYAELGAAGVPLFRHLHTAAWGARTFIVRDPDGNLILFAG